MLAYGFRSDDVEKQEKQSKNETMKPKTRRHHTSKSDEPDVQESAFLKKIIAYQRKLLVWTAYSFSLSSSSYHYYSYYYTTSQSIALKNTFFAHLLVSPTELLRQKLLQHEDVGSVCCLCNKLYPSVL